MRTLSIILFAIAVLAAPVAAQSSQEGGADASRLPTIVMIHADWCAKCSAIELAWMQVEQELADEARIVVFDVTDRETTRAAAAEARALGFETFFEGHKAQTGLVAVFAPGETERPAEVLVVEREFEPYREAVDAVTPEE